MLRSKPIAKLLTLRTDSAKFLAGLLLALCVGPVMALNLAIGSGHLITLEGEAATVFVADPEIADVQMRSAGAILVFGRRAGTTTLYALDEQNKQLLRQ
ncbi:pilus assembly protein N-terminal domain-containing protein, partial [Photobacterium phosphoreum]|uniref:pilus assembly protein N-terminal domain-containing protein n=1 Tax=Photobacterium phosphoreum TaxID=659 RepID=UPI001E2EAD99